jgi:single-stranded DNA-binding protein
MQFIHISGFVGQDATISQNVRGEQMRFSVAVSRKKSDGTEVTAWYTVFYYNTKIAEYIKKGTYVTVAGDFNAGLYTPQQGSFPVLQLTINAAKVDFVNRNTPTSAATAGAGSPQGASVLSPEADALYKPLGHDDMAF